MTRSGPLLRSRKIAKNKSGVQISLTPRQARWEYVGFAVRQIATGETWTGRTRRDEICLVLLSGLAWVTWAPGQRKRARLGPRRDVFSDYPHAVYLPPGSTFEVVASRHTEIAE